MCREILKGLESLPIPFVLMLWLFLVSIQEYPNCSSMNGFRRKKQQSVEQFAQRLQNLKYCHNGLAATDTDSWHLINSVLKSKYGIRSSIDVHSMRVSKLTATISDDRLYDGVE